MLLCSGNSGSSHVLIFNHIQVVFQDVLYGFKTVGSKVKSAFAGINKSLFANLLFKRKYPHTTFKRLLRMVSAFNDFKDIFPGNRVNTVCPIDKSLVQSSRLQIDGCSLNVRVRLCSCKVRSPGDG